MEEKVIYKDLSYKIVGIMYEVFNELGSGYQEKHYERAIEKYFIKDKIKYLRQAPYILMFQGEKIGRYYLDFLVDDKIVLELKKGNYFSKNNINQIKGYLQATGKKLGILANFTSSGVKVKRVLNPNNLRKDDQ